MLPSSTAPVPGFHHDTIPEGPAPLPEVPATATLPRVILHVREVVRTAMNKFLLLREYPHRPSYDPDGTLTTAADLADYTTSSQRTASNTDSSASVSSSEPFVAPPSPFSNMSIYHLMHWMTTGSNTKSLAETDRLVKEVILAKEFNAADLREHLPSNEVHKLDRANAQLTDANAPLGSRQGTGWKNVPLSLSIPTGTAIGRTSSAMFTVPGASVRSLVAVIRSAFATPLAQHFHLTPFKRLWNSLSGEQRVYDELYTSDAWLEADDELQKSPREEGCTLERVIAGLTFWSDATTLAHFTSAKAWPVYLYFGNLSKYIGSGAGSGACHHVAYIPSVCV